MKKEGPRGRYRRVLTDAVSVLKRGQYQDKVIEIEEVLEQTKVAPNSKGEQLRQVQLLAATIDDLLAFVQERGLAGLESFIREQTQVNSYNHAMQ